MWQCNSIGMTLVMWPSNYVMAGGWRNGWRGAIVANGVARRIWRYSLSKMPDG